MIAIVWGVLAALLCGGIYGAGRVLARDDMPLTDLPGGERDHSLSRPRSPATTRPVASLPGPVAEPLDDFAVRAGEPDPAGQSTYQVLYAMASAVNDAWLDRLFAGGSGVHCG